MTLRGGGGGGSEGVTLIFYLKHTLTFREDDVDDWVACETCSGWIHIPTAFHLTTRILSQMPTLIAMFVSVS